MTLSASLNRNHKTAFTCRRSPTHILILLGIRAIALSLVYKSQAIRASNKIEELYKMAVFTVRTMFDQYRTKVVV